MTEHGAELVLLSTRSDLDSVSHLGSGLNRAPKSQPKAARVTPYVRGQVFDCATQVGSEAVSAAAVSVLVLNTLVAVRTEGGLR